MPQPLVNNAPPGSMVLNGILYVPGPIYPVKAGNITVNSGTGIPTNQSGAGTAPNRTSRDIPSGSKILVRAASVTLLNGPAADLLLTIGCGNAFPNWFQVPGSSFAALGEIPIGEIGDAPGPVFIDVYNIDGTTIAGATGGGINLTLSVFLDCLLLVEANRRGLHG